MPMKKEIMEDISEEERKKGEEVKKNRGIKKVTIQR